MAGTMRSWRHIDSMQFANSSAEYHWSARCAIKQIEQLGVLPKSNFQQQYYNFLHHINIYDLIEQQDD